MAAQYLNDITTFLTERKLATYGAIAVASLAIGAHEALEDTGYIVRALEIGVPILSACMGARTEAEENLGLGAPELMGTGLRDAFATGAGAVTGAGLSVLCQLTGAGLAKLVTLFS